MSIVPILGFSMISILHQPCHSWSSTFQLRDTVPATIRNMTDCSVDTFKRCLDKYLGMVPDEPHICGYVALRRAESNSLFDMAQFASAQLVSALEEPDQVSVARGGHP